MTSVICLVDVALLIVFVAALLMKGAPIDAAPKLSVLSGANRRSMICGLVMLVMKTLAWAFSLSSTRTGRVPF